MPTTHRTAQYSARASLTVSKAALFNVRSVINPTSGRTFSARVSRPARKASQHHALVPSGWRVYARNVSTGVETDLGFVDVDSSPAKITDAALVDGIYEIEARSSDLFWRDCRSGKRQTVVISGGVITSQKLPVIYNLRRKILNSEPRLSWGVLREYNGSTIQFGIWFGVSSPVSVAGSPDATVTYFLGQAEYQYKYTQSTNRYVAVAAMSATETGPETEIEITWSTAAPDSPPNQLSQKEI